MRYADPLVCPDCRQPLGKASDRCPACYLDLSTPPAAALWQALLQADYHLAALRNQSSPMTLSPESAARIAGSLPPPPLPPPLSKEKVKLRVDTVLLTLGALFILVAGSVFSALFLGIFGLFLMSAVAALMASGALAKKLTRAAEALTAIAFGLSALSVAVFTGPQGSTGTIVWSLLLLAPAWLLTRASFPRASLLFTPRCVVAATVGSLSAGVAFRLQESVQNDFWPFMVALLIAAVGAIYSQRQRWRCAALPLAALTAFYGLAVEWLALEAYLNHGSFRALFMEGYGYPLLLLTVVAFALSRFSRHKTIAAAFATIGLAHGVLAVVVPAGEIIDGLGLAVSAASALLLLSLKVKISYLEKACAWVGVTAFFFAAFSLFTPMVLQSFEAIDGLLRYRALSPLSEVTLETRGYSWPIVLATGSLLILTHRKIRQRKNTLVPEWSSELQIILVSLTVIFTVTAAYVTPLTATAVGFTLAGAWLFVKSKMSAMPVVIVAVTPALAMGSFTLLLAALLLSSIFAFILCLRTSSLVAQAALFFAAAYPAVVLALAAEESSWPLTSIAVSLLVVGLCFVAAVAVLEPRHPHLGLEAASAVVLAAAFFYALSNLWLWPAFIASTVGFGLLLRSVLRPAPIYQAFGAALLAFGWWFRLIHSNVTTVEAYTAPVGAAFVVAALVVLWRRKDVKTFTVLAPGLLASLLPTMGLYVAEPTLVRGSVLCLVGVPLLLAGLALKWKAFFIFGALPLLLVALVELGPYAADLHRWLLIGVIGLLLLAIGATWEKRVLEGKKVLAFVQHMR